LLLRIYICIFLELFSFIYYPGYSAYCPALPFSRSFRAMSLTTLNHDIMQYLIFEFLTTPTLLRNLRLLHRRTESIYQSFKERILQRMLCDGGLDPFVSIAKGRGDTWEQSALQFLRINHIFRPSVSACPSISDLRNRLRKFGGVSVWDHVKPVCNACARPMAMAWVPHGHGHGHGHGLSYQSTRVSTFLKNIPVAVRGAVVLICTHAECGYRIHIATFIQSRCFHALHTIIKQPSGPLYKVHKVYDVVSTCSVCNCPVCRPCTLVCDDCGEFACSGPASACIAVCDTCDYNMCRTCGDTIVCTICKDSVCYRCQHKYSGFTGSATAADVCISCLESEMLA
jgi:hypothetical protein